MAARGPGPGRSPWCSRGERESSCIPGEPGHTIGLRVPDHDLVRAIAERTGPIAATSANRHGQPTHPTAGEAAASLTAEPDLVVDGGPLDASASTVVDASRTPWVALRHGPIDPTEVIAAGIG